jgi:hypothetical protein
MALLSNINDKFAVDSTGAIQFNGQVGTSGYGGPYLPLTGGTLTGNLAISGSNSLTVGGTLTGTSATFVRDTSGYALRLDSPNATTDNDLRFAKAGTDYAAIQVDGTTASNFQFYVNNGTNWINTLNFARADGQATFTQLVSGITPTAAANFATKAYVDAHPGENTSWPNIIAGTRTNYSLNFQPPTANYAGFEFLTSAGTSAGYFLIRGASDAGQIYKAEGITLVSDSSWVTIASRTTTAAGVRLMSGSTSVERLVIKDDGDSYFTGNVGIGMSSPNYLLDLSKTAVAVDTYSGINLQASNYGYTIEGGLTQNIGGELIFSSNSLGTKTPRVKFAANGNVGIGTNSPSTPLTIERATNSDEPSLYLDTAGGAAGSVGMGNTSTIGPFLMGNTNPDGTVRGAYSACRMLFNGLGFSFQTSDETSGARTFDDKMKILINGNVGINTTSPGQKLHLNETGSTSVFAQWSNNGQGKNSYLGLTSAGMFAMQTNDNIAFYTGASYTERMRITSDGMVGIGMTPSTAGSSTYMLQMYNPGSQCLLSIGNGTSGNGPLNGLVIGNDTNAAYITNREATPLYFGTSDANRMVILAGGNVGIGITTPQTTLQVNGTASALNAHFGQGQNNTSGVFGGISLGYAENANAAYRKVAIVAQAKGDGAARQDLHFLVDTVADGNSADIADSKMSIQYNTGDVIINNNLGIGVTGPTEKLVVAGKVMINNTNVPNNLAQLNIGYTGGGETRAIDIDGGWSSGESKSISFTYGTATTNLVGQINCQHNSPGSRIRWGKLYHNGTSSTYTMELISTSQTAANLTVAGNITAAADVVAYSDKRLKSNIKTLDGSKVLKMRGVSFEKEGKKGSGVIAQELEKVAPELVNNDNEYKGVAYGNLTGYLIEAIKELEARVKELENK